MMAHAQKPDFVFRRNGRVHLNRHGASVQSTIGSRGVLISGSNAGYTMFRGSVKSTGYPLHSPVSPSLPPPVRHRVPSHLNWTQTFGRRSSTSYGVDPGSNPREVAVHRVALGCDAAGSLSFLWTDIALLILTGQAMHV